MLSGPEYGIFLNNKKGGGKGVSKDVDRDKGLVPHSFILFHTIIAGVHRFCFVFFLCLIYVSLFSCSYFVYVFI